MMKLTVQDIKSLPREEVSRYVRSLVFQLDPKDVGDLIYQLDIKNSKELNIHREIMSCILMFVCSGVDAHMRSCKSCIPDAALISECIQEYLMAYYQDAGIAPNAFAKPSSRVMHLN